MGSSGKKVVFHHRLDLLFVAPFPNAVIKNNNADNSVPSTKQLAEIPTSFLLKNGIHAPALLPSSGYSRRRFLTHLNGSYYIFTKEIDKKKKQQQQKRQSICASICCTVQGFINIQLSHSKESPGFLFILFTLKSALNGSHIYWNLIFVNNRKQKLSYINTGGQFYTDSVALSCTFHCCCFFLGGGPWDW